ncbi:MAG: hypothetical protein ACYTGQ_16925, partial [Planctomycetota bacterium]
MRTMRGCVGLALLTGAWLCGESQAVVVELTSGRRVAGWVVQEDAEMIRLSSVGERAEGGAVRRINRDEITRLIYTVDESRLESLTPSEPGGYHAYAEELSVMRIDPEARAMAERLFVIAAHLAPAELGGASMLGLIDLTQDQDESKADGYRAMAYLLDPGLRRVLSRGDAASATNVPAPGDGAARSEAVAWQRFKEALRYFRRGDFERALEGARSDSVRGMFGRVDGLMSFGSFERACLDRIGGLGGASATGLGVNVPMGQLRLMLLIEMSDRPGLLAPKPVGGSDPVEAIGRGVGDWPDVIARGGGKPVKVMDLRLL